MKLIKYNKYLSVNSSHNWLDDIVLSIIKKIGCKDIIDIGCGNGNFASKLKKSGFNVCGIDPESSGIEIAKNKFPDISFYEYSVYDDPKVLDFEKVDLITSLEVIEHLFLPRKLLVFSKYLLKPNGKIIISTPYYGSYIKNLICSLFNKWDDQFTALWDGGHIKFWSLNTLRKLFEKENFNVVFYKTCNRKSFFLNKIWPNNIIIVAEKK